LQQQQAVPPSLPLFLFDQKPFPDRPACTSSPLVLWPPHNNTTHNQIPHSRRKRRRSRKRRKFGLGFIENASDLQP
jgi:hypothetical protein